MNKSLRKLLAAAAVPLMVNAGISSAEEIRMEPVYKPGTGIVKGQNPRMTAPGQAQFEANLEGLSLVALKKLGDTNRSAIIFKGEPTSGRLCPYFDTATRQKKIQQVGGDWIFLVTTTASDEERQAVEKYGCVVSPTARIGEIEFNPGAIAKKLNPLPDWSW
ncbi:MAG TPA: hypothetical protein VIF12_04700 [Micavibrio sp.]